MARVHETMGSRHRSVENGKILYGVEAHLDMVVTSVKHLDRDQTSAI